MPWLKSLYDWMLRFCARKPLSLGAQGERAAARYLKRRGHIIIARNQRERLGEIDLITVYQKKIVVFVEVKTRRSRELGHPAEAITPDKQRRLSRLALTYLKRHDLLESPSRFDIIAIVWPAAARRPEIEHFENAFEPVGQGQMYS